LVSKKRTLAHIGSKRMARFTAQVLALSKPHYLSHTTGDHAVSLAR
jgi:hypothetical protein